MDFGLLMQPELLLDEEGHTGEEASGECKLRYQQSIIDVYTRFCVPDGLHKQFLIHRKAMFRITDLVMDKLRVADSSVASLEGNIVQGVQGGRTEVQVCTQNYSRKPGTVTQLLKELQWDTLQTRRTIKRPSIIYIMEYNLIDIPLDYYIQHNTRSSRKHDSQFLQIRHSANIFGNSFFPTTIKNELSVPKHCLK